MQVKLQLLGTFFVALNGQPVTDFRSDKTRALLAYLVVEGATPIRRSVLADLLWSGYSAASARSSLRMALLNLKQLFKENKLLQTTYRTVQYMGHPANIWCDVQVLEVLLQRDLAAFPPEDQAEVRFLGQGDFLAGFETIDSQPFQDWLQQQRVRVRQQLAQVQLRLDSHPQRQSPVRTHNLPRALTPLVGRTAEIAALARLLEDGQYPLIVVTGEGGIGKTRLALSAAETSLNVDEAEQPPPKFADGIWFVPLAGITPGVDVAEQLASTIGAVLGVTFSGQIPLQEQLVVWLRKRALLLILDNMEHLMAGVPLLLALLKAAPQVKVLVTSRQRLNVQAATHFPVYELAVPAERAVAALSADQLLTYPSIQLFTEQARRAHPGFQLQAENQLAVGRICHLVAGLPLAIELAATLLEIYPCQTVAELLAKDYTVLTTDQTDRPPHQRSLQTVLDASWQMLTAEEAQVLAQCALLRAEFTTEAATHITGVTPPQLRSLVHKSLLRQSTQPPVRFSLHELVRQYAGLRLELQPQLHQQATARHANYYLQFLQNQGVLLGQKAEAMHQVREEWENIRTAWFASVAAGNVELLARSLENFARFYRLSGLHSEATQGLLAAIASIRPYITPGSPTLPALLLGRLLSHAAEFCRRQGHLDEGEQLAQEALDQGIATAEPMLQGMAYHELAQIAHRRGRYTGMCALAEQGAHQAQLGQLPQLEAECLSDLGIANVYLSELTPAIHHFQAALQCLRQAPNRSLEARFTSNLGSAYLIRRDYLAARHYLTQALNLAYALNDQQAAAIRLIFLGDLWCELGMYAQAHQAYNAAWQILQVTLDPYWVGWLHTSWGRLWRLQGDLTAAYTQCTTGLQLVQQAHMYLREHRVLTSLGHILAGLGAKTEAADSFQQAIRVAQQAGLRTRVADPLAGLAELCLAQNDWPGALKLVEEMLVKLNQQGLEVAEEPFQIYWTCYRILQQPNPARAAALLQQADEQLQALAARIDDATLQQAFLTQVAVNRAIRTAAQAAQATGCVPSSRLHATHGRQPIL